MFKVSYIYDLVDNISPQLKKIQANLEQTRQKISNSAQSMSNGFDKVKSNLDKIGNKSSQIGRNLILRTTLPLGLLGNKFIKVASDYQESLNKVDVAFGSAANSVKSFSESAGKNFGIDRGSALDMAAMFGDMSTSMGLSQTKAADLSTKLVGLTGDLASFKNINLGEATTALAGIFTGETESLKRLGIVMTEINLQQFALTNGITKKMQKMSQDEKVLLRYNYIMAMTKNSQGDFTRTQIGFANQTRILSSRFKDLSITLGSILLPYANKILGVIINLIGKFQALSPTTQKIILVLGALAVIIPPLLIAFGFMASAIVAIGAALALLISPLGLIIVGIAALGAAGYLLKDSFMVVFNFLKDEFLLIFDAIGAKIDAAIVKFNSFRTDVASVLSFVGLDSLANSVAPSPLNQAASQNINQQQQINAGGQLNININGLPKGSNAGFTPIPKNFLPVGVNSVFAGS